MGSAGGQGVFQMFAVVAEAFKAERTLTYVKMLALTRLAHQLWHLRLVARDPSRLILLL